MGEPGGAEIYCVAAATLGCVIQNNQYVVDKSTGTQTASFEMVLEPQDNDIQFLNNIQVEKIDKDFNPLF